ncbi:MAG: S41 family peptidase, partial [Ruthenibacterium sp.]
TASGAELFAGAVREFEIGQLVGVNTAGKGSVQCTPIRLSDGAAISYTVGTLLTGKSVPFDGVGFAPDVESVLKADEEKNFYDLNVDTDSQIAKAKEVVASVIAHKPNGGTPPAGGNSAVASEAGSASAPAA